MRLIRSYLDVLGFSASFLCAVHCILVPLVLSFGLVGGLSWLNSPAVEWGFMLSTLFLASWSLFGSYPRHKDRRPLLMAAIGFFIIFAVHLMEALIGHYVAALGGIIIAYAHYLNWQILHGKTHKNQAPVSFESIKTKAA